jgi:hypothetical protein
MALDSLHSAEEQVKVAEAGLSLSQSEFTQARRRYEAGVASSIEVTDAQTRLERARDNRIAALFNHNVARIDLGQATGTIQAMLRREPSAEPGQPVMTEPKAPETAEWIAMPPPELSAAVQEPRIPQVLAATPAVRRRTHRRAHRRPAATAQRRATKSA